MKTQNLMRIAFVVVLTIFISNSYLFGQQWQGPNNTTSAISRTGNVGIGTPSPTTKLHIKESTSKVNPNIRIEDSKGDGIHVGYNTGGNFGALSSNTGGKSYWDTLIWKGGLVGIGTTSPTAKLHIKESTSKVNPNIRIEDSKGDGIHVGYNTSENFGALSSNTGGKYYPNTLIWKGGLVGIGTTSPEAKLHIKGNDYPNSFIFLTSDINKDAGFRFYEGNTVKYHLYNDASEDALRIDGGPVSIGGRTGIGTTKPTQLLHIKESTSKVNPNLRIEDSKGDGIHVGYNTSKNYGALNSNTGGTYYWDTLVWKEGQVGIGGAPWQQKYTTGETFKPSLTVHGNVRLESVPVWDGPDDYDLTWGAGYSGGVAYNPNLLFISREGSSLRYKKDLRPEDEAFSKILNVSPKRYQMREGYGPRGVWNFGYIAEDLDKAGLRNLVIYDEKGRPDGVKYKKMVIYVNEVVKMQQKKIDQLEAEIAALKKVVDELKK